jgi:signal transduction histidine kinase
MEGRARRLGVTLILELPPDPPPILADADRLQQVVVNLLDNALKFTPAGGRVWLRILYDKNAADLIVADEGPGLGEVEMERVFEPYYRGPGGGAGLGLTIAHEIVTVHGGQIWLEARAGGGTEARFRLPYSPT